SKRRRRSSCASPSSTRPPRRCTAAAGTARRSPRPEARGTGYLLKHVRLDEEGREQEKQRQHRHHERNELLESLDPLQRTRRGFIVDMRLHDLSFNGDVPHLLSGFRQPSSPTRSTSPS